MILKTLISMLRCVWLGLELNSAGMVQIWGSLVYTVQLQVGMGTLRTVNFRAILMPHTLLSRFIELHTSSDLNICNLSGSDEWQEGQNAHSTGQMAYSATPHFLINQSWRFPARKKKLARDVSRKEKQLGIKKLKMNPIWIPFWIRNYILL